MKNKRVFTSSLIVALALGTAWAVRGKFGHEQGAAWAGGVGALAMLLVAKRNDWYNNAFKIALAAAFGWGIGGMISYGVVVGYGRGSDFVNVYYGLLMLFVIGGLYGFLGGGLFGLALTDSKETPVKWHALITEMLAFGLLTYALVINQLEWFMTPPRSEMWAACFGASIAVAWHIIRHQKWSVLKVAVWSTIGAGFGFAFGNFLQVLGNVLNIGFNFWNVMEYSIGFFGGLGMAYGTLTSQWPVLDEKRGRYTNVLPILLLMLFIPFVVWDQSFVSDKLESLLERGGTVNTIFLFRLISILAILIMTALTIRKDQRIMRGPTSYDFLSVRNAFVWYLGVYTFLSFLVTGPYVHPLEQYLYLVNIGVILFVLPGLKDNFDVQEEKPKRWMKALLLLVLILGLLAFILIHSHGELRGSQIRFER